jgi:exo-beta-1,3-glucanase (GH17 family)
LSGRSRRAPGWRVAVVFGVALGWAGAVAAAPARTPALAAPVGPACRAAAVAGAGREGVAGGIGRNGPALERLRATMATGRFVAYQPTSLRVHDGRPTRADAASIRADLRALRPYFDGLVTYDVVHGAEQVPAIAAALGFRALVLGLWDPFDDAQVEAALAAARAHPALVVGLSLGNETVYGKRRTFAQLAARVAAIRRRAPGLALATSEPFHLLLEPAATPLLAQLDLLLPNVHPVFEPWFRGAPDGNAARFVVEVVEKLGARHCGPILVKETGVPTAPGSAGFSAARQSGFYAALQQQLPPSRQRAFAYFAAFDAAWREHDWHPVPGAHPEEAHWGLFFEDRRPKPVVRALSRLQHSAPGAASDPSGGG